MPFYIERAIKINLCTIFSFPHFNPFIMPKKCVNCAVAKGKTKYSTGQWKKASGVCLCVECAVKQKAAEAAPQPTILAPKSMEGKTEKPAAKPLQRCSTCNKASAELFSCSRCKAFAYCGRECQRKDWPTHKTECKQIQKLIMKQVYSPDDASSESNFDAAPQGPAQARGGGGGGGSSVPSEHIAARRQQPRLKPGARATGCDEDFENPCPICLDNEDYAVHNGTHSSGMCTACGQMYCGACNLNADKGMLAERCKNCPMCRSPLLVSPTKNFKRLLKLLHDRSPGRHTAAAQLELGWMYSAGFGVKKDISQAINWFQRAAEKGLAMAQFNLGGLYVQGTDVQQDYTKAAKFFKLSAAQGFAAAQHSLGLLYFEGNGVQQDFIKAFELIQRAAEQGVEEALANLDGIQQNNAIPKPTPGTAVTTTLLSSAASAKFNGRTGVVVAPPAAIVKPGRVAVLLDGETNTLSFKLMNLRV